MALAYLSQFSFFQHESYAHVPHVPFIRPESQVHCRVYPSTGKKKKNLRSHLRTAAAYREVYPLDWEVVERMPRELLMSSMVIIQRKKRRMRRIYWVQNSVKAHSDDFPRGGSSPSKKGDSTMGDRRAVRSKHNRTVDQKQNAHSTHRLAIERLRTSGHRNQSFGRWLPLSDRSK